MRFVVGYEDLGEFREYYRELNLPWGELSNSINEGILSGNPAQVILWKRDEAILGHAIWHESSTVEHGRGSPRDAQDRELLETLLGERKSFVELHEVWLRREHRGKGYGKQFFDFFEEFIANRGHDTIVYYADDPAALTICRRRGYREAKGKWSVFALSVSKKP